MTIGWQDLVMNVVRQSYEPGRRFQLQNLYQQIKGSPHFAERSEIADVEATIRNCVNKLVKAGELERLGRGEYRHSG